MGLLGFGAMVTLGLAVVMWMTPRVVNKKEMVQPSLQVGAQEEVIDQKDDDWLIGHCMGVIPGVAIIPTSYERMRGPTVTFDPLYKPERYAGREAATCDFDYYIAPVNKEAFAQLGITYAYSQVTWQEFHEAVAKFIENRLKREGFLVVEKANEAKSQPDLELVRSNRELGLVEYLDVFFHDDEEIVFELLVVVGKGK